MWVLVVVLVAIAVSVWWLRSAQPDAATAPAAGPGIAAPPAATEVGQPTAAAPPQSTAPTPVRADARARRDALREQILRQLAQRPAAASDGTPPAARGAGSLSAPPSEGLRNKMDERRQAVVDQLNRDFMPLAKECVGQAEQRTPQLIGTVVLAMETVADEQLGAVVDVAEPAPTNEVPDPLLFECLRESAFSLSLPPPPTGGRMKALITLKPDDASGGRP